MIKYQLLKLVDWAGTLRSRKRMQKAVFLLQAAGCPLDVEYGFHQHGPYSSDLAQLTDQLVGLGLLEEQCEPGPTGALYNYRLATKCRKLLHEAEARGAEPMTAKMAPFQHAARRLFKADVRKLELASTIAYFRIRTGDWAQALEKACRLKALDRSDPLATRAMTLAQEAVDRAPLAMTAK